MLAGSRDAAGQADREQRFRRLFVDHYRNVLGYAMRRTDRADAEDVTAMVFLTAWRRFDECPDGPDSLLWLYGVARRVVANQQRGQLRRQRLLARLNSVRSEPAGASNPTDREESSMVRDALNQLKPADQEVLRFATWEGLTYAEIGQVLGCSEGTVAVRLHRARRRMERQLLSVGFAGVDSLTGSMTFTIRAGLVIEHFEEPTSSQTAADWDRVLGGFDAWLQATYPELYDQPRFAFHYTPGIAELELQLVEEWMATR